MAKTNRAFVQAALQRIRIADTTSECRHVNSTSGAANDATVSQQDPGRPGQTAPEERGCELATEYGGIKIMSSMINGRRHVEDHSLPKGAVAVRLNILQRVLARKSSRSYALLVLHCWRSFDCRPMCLRSCVWAVSILKRSPSQSSGVFNQSCKFPSIVLPTPILNAAPLRPHTGSLLAA